MKRKLTVQFMAFVACVGVVVATTIPGPIEEKSIHAVWVGHNVSLNEFCRISLQQHKGFLAMSYQDQAPKLYEIKSWSLDAKGQLKFSVTPISTNAYSVLISGKAKTYEVGLTIRDPKGGWMQEFSLHKEDVIERRVQALKDSMEQVKNHDK